MGATPYRAPGAHGDSSITFNHSLDQVRQDIAYQQKPPLSSQEAAQASSWLAEGKSFPWVAKAVLEARKVGAAGRAVSASRRKRRVTSMTLTDAERDLMARLLGRLLYDGQLAGSHVARLLDKLERSSER